MCTVLLGFKYPRFWDTERDMKREVRNLLNAQLHYRGVGGVSDYKVMNDHYTDSCKTSKSSK